MQIYVRERQVNSTDSQKEISTHARCLDQN